MGAAHSVAEDGVQVVLAEECRQALVAFQSNAWHGPGDGRMSLYATLSRVNHSCDPNAYTSSDGDRAVLKATRPISPGEEIMPSYLTANLLERPLQERRQAIAQTWGFWCECHRCIAEQSLM